MMQIIRCAVRLLSGLSDKECLAKTVSKGSQDSDTVLESVLKGKTLQVYWYIVSQSSQSVGVRQVQRALSFSSPSIAVHHLEKLQDLGLVHKSGTGEYLLEREVKVGILKFFTRMGRFLVPRYLFYSVFFSTMLSAYLILCIATQLTPNFYTVTFGALAMLIFWVETVRQWKERPF
jgi:DNA-binding transcriptional ArsR family regulator